MALRRQIDGHHALYLLDEREFFRVRWQLLAAARILWGEIKPSAGYRKWFSAQYEGIA